MQSLTQRKTVLLLALCASLVAALFGILIDADLRDRIGPTYWIIALAIIACVLLVLSGYVFDLTLQTKLRALRATAHLDSDETADARLLETDELTGLARNIERLARALQMAEAGYRGLVEDQADLVCRHGPDGPLTFVNAAFARAFSRSPADLLGKPFPIFPAHRANDGEVATLEQEHVRSDGRRIWLSWTRRRLADEHGALLEYQVIGRDITLQREIADAYGRATEQAAAAEREADARLAGLGRELFHPLTRLLDFAHVMEKSELTSEQRHQLAMIQATVGTLVSLVTDRCAASPDTPRFQVELRREPLSVRPREAGVR